jgi:hypothetical protein
MTSPIDPQEAPAYTRESVMAYLRSAEAERQRIRLAIADARARTVSARRRTGRLSSLDQASADSTWEPIRLDTPSAPAQAGIPQFTGGRPLVQANASQANGPVNGHRMGGTELGIVSDFDQLIGAVNAPVKVDDGNWIPINAPAIRHD